MYGIVGIGLVHWALHNPVTFKSMPKNNKSLKSWIEFI